MRAARGSLIGWVLVAALASASCSGGGDDPPPISSAPPASATAVTPSGSPTPSPVEPTLPPEAMAETDIGAVAFVKYWYSLVNYANRTGEQTPITLASASTCLTCSDYARIAREKAEAGSMLDGDYFVLEAVNAPKPENGLVIVEVVVSTAAVNELNRDGTTAPLTAGEPTRTKALVEWQSSRWVMIGIGQK